MYSDFMKLKKYLQIAGISVMDFANKTAISVPSIYKYITGERFPRNKHIKIIHKHTKGEVTANDFYNIIKK